MVGHVAPEAAVGGPLAALRDNDIITIDIDSRKLDAELTSSLIVERMRKWAPPESRYKTGVFAKYAHLVSSASDGAITRVPNS